MGTKAGLCKALKVTGCLRTNILLFLGLGLVRVLGRNMIIKRLLSRCFIITMSALVLEGSTMLGLDVHMNCRLILLGKRAMGALELSVRRAQILESHFWGLTLVRETASIFCQPIKLARQRGHINR
jgi:hypothetical protein